MSKLWRAYAAHFLIGVPTAFASVMGWQRAKKGAVPGMLLTEPSPGLFIRDADHGPLKHLQLETFHRILGKYVVAGHSDRCGFGAVL
ncbi:hypothetical protein QF047_002245 [Arthrobacter sp. W4I7]|nr:hypothetical protein [Arthrobacter sp. W4I7]